MRTSEDEGARVERIEHVRARLNASGGRSDTLRVNDLGYAVLMKSAPKMWGLVLFHVIRMFRLERCLELGTAFGISAAFQGAALDLNGGGRLVTIEGLEARAVMARETLDELGLDWVDVRNGLFEDLLDPVLEELGTVDLAFIDGNHTEAATIAYFEQILPYVSERGVFVFDDIDWSDGMRRVWGRVSADRRLRLAVDLGRFGICLPGAPGDPPASHVVPL